jgi:hypothetical protein
VIIHKYSLLESKKPFILLEWHNLHQLFLVGMLVGKKLGVGKLEEGTLISTILGTMKIDTGMSVGEVLGTADFQIEMSMGKFPGASTLEDGISVGKICGTDNIVLGISLGEFLRDYFPKLNENGPFSTQESSSKLL